MNEILIFLFGVWLGIMAMMIRYHRASRVSKKPQNTAVKPAKQCRISHMHQGVREAMEDDIRSGVSFTVIATNMKRFGYPITRQAVAQYARQKMKINRSRKSISAS
jgi:hypothetical protein